jgi:DNA-entry nuclease
MKARGLFRMRKVNQILLPLLIALCLMLSACSGGNTGSFPTTNDPAGSPPATSVSEQSSTPSSTPNPYPPAAVSVSLPSAQAAGFSLQSIPAYSGSPYIAVNNNHPFFSVADSTTVSFESYSDLDSLGRCGAALANVSKDTMPTEKRGSIGHIKPSGFHIVKYDMVDGKYLYNRCHLIGYQLTAENDNPKNLITGTRYLNTEGMLPIENLVADYIMDTGNHVLYRVTPVFDGNNLVAAGVLMEALSVEDSGKGVCYNVFCYNSQPGVFIDYATGDSCLSGELAFPGGNPNESNTPGNTTDHASSQNYILNTNTRKFHDPSCRSADEIKESNRQTYAGNRKDLIDQGYSPCGICQP